MRYKKLIICSGIFLLLIILVLTYFVLFPQSFRWSSVKPAKIAEYEGVRTYYAEMARHGISVSGKLIAMAKMGGVIDMKNLERLKSLHPFQSLNNPVKALAFSRSGKFLAATDGTAIKVYATSPWKVAAKLESGVRIFALSSLQMIST